MGIARVRSAALLIALAAVVLLPIVMAPFGGRADAATAWTSTAALPAPRTNATTTLLRNGQVLVAGGVDDLSQPQATAYLYNPATQTWTQASSMHTARSSHAAALLANGTVLVAGGTTTAQNQTPPTATAEVFDPATSTWSSVGSMAAPRWGFAATTLSNGKVLVAGGENAATDGCICEELRTAELYNPATRTWSAAGSMSQGRTNPTATLLSSGDVLVVGGYRGQKFDTSDPLADSEVYVGSTGQWRLTGDMIIQRQLHEATLLPDGRVFVAGGLPANLFNVSGHVTPTTPDAEFYEPNATDLITGRQGTWVPASPMPSGRAQHGQALLADGRVLVAGGVDDNEQAINSALLYDPATDAWLDAGSMLTARSAFAVVRLSTQPCGSVCNDVLVAGGASGNGLLLGAGTAAAELFTAPASAAGAASGGRNGAAAGGVPVPDTGSDGIGWWPLSATAAVVVSVLILFCAGRARVKRWRR
ncbi:MAG TPA: kelch repeat-containing protein [Candidatus Dormibacteraeota bacterium]